MYEMYKIVKNQLKKHTFVDINRLRRKERAHYSNMATKKQDEHQSFVGSRVKWCC